MCVCVCECYVCAGRVTQRDLYAAQRINDVTTIITATATDENNFDHANRARVLRVSRI